MRNCSRACDLSRSVRHLLPFRGLSESALHCLGVGSISHGNTSRQDSEKQLRTVGLGALSTLTAAEMKLPARHSLPVLMQTPRSPIPAPGQVGTRGGRGSGTLRVHPHRRSEEKLRLNLFSTLQKGFQTKYKNPM